eukprot:16530-Prymnesium_polylepis.1
MVMWEKSRLTTKQRPQPMSYAARYSCGRIQRASKRGSSPPKQCSATSATASPSATSKMETEKARFADWNPERTHPAAQVCPHALASLANRSLRGQKRHVEPPRCKRRIVAGESDRPLEAAGVDDEHRRLVLIHIYFCFLSAITQSSYHSDSG